MDKLNLQISEWKNSNVRVFWGEIAPCDHLAQFGQEDNHFLHTLENFAACGLLSDDSVIIIATQSHLDSLNERLLKQNIDIHTHIKSDRYFPLEVNETLSKFIVGKWPDEKLFEKYISSILARATKDNKKVRAFGEMVAVLWQLGLNGATHKLEHLWLNFHARKKFSLYCAYPKSGFTQNAKDSIETICNVQKNIIQGETRPLTEIYYKIKL